MKLFVYISILFVLAVMVYLLLPKFMCIGCEYSCTNFIKTIKQLETSTKIMKRELVKFNNKTSYDIYKSVVLEHKDAWDEPIMIKIINAESRKFILYSKGWDKLDDNIQGNDISLSNKDLTLEKYCIQCEENNMSCRFWGHR